MSALTDPPVCTCGQVMVLVGQHEVDKDPIWGCMHCDNPHPRGGPCDACNKAAMRR